MNSEKTGKLIAKLRRQEGLTQQELGDKVGVGFRAVSNWERGNTLPDIGNMNELIKIFGITLDELMAGELNEKVERKDSNQKFKKSKTIISGIITLLTVFACIAVVISHYNNKTYVYKLSSANESEYIVEGQMTFHKNDISIIVNKIKFQDKNLYSTNINHYEYKIMANDVMIFGYGMNPDNILEKPTTIEEIMNNLRINYTTHSFIKRKKVLDTNIRIMITFKTDTTNQTIEKTVELELIKSTEK